jgi:hypothetical protein
MTEHVRPELTTQEVRDDYAYYQDWELERRQQEFDAWLTKVKAEARADGLAAAGVPKSSPKTRCWCVDSSCQNDTHDHTVRDGYYSD